MVDGVMAVYKNEEALEKNQPQAWNLPNLQMYLVDQTALLNMISDGPL